MFGLRTPARVPCRFCQHLLSQRSYSKKIKVGLGAEPALPKKRGPPKGKVRDPTDPSKTVNRANVINFKPRGPTVGRAANKSTSSPPILLL